MPTARFAADFSEFQAACAKADVTLNGFEGNANKVQTSLNRMANSLSGTKLIQDATLMSEAVDRIGGISKLTENELARVSAQAAEAVEKMKALGTDVPPGLQKLADETKNVDKASAGLLDTAKSVALGFVAMSTARAAFNFVSRTLDEASALNDLAAQTHISVEEIQLLGGAMSEFGVDSDTLAKGLYRLSRGIAGGDDSVAQGLHLMGMSLKDVEGLNGKDLFLKIEEGLATLQGGLRDTAAADLFGGRLGAAMAGASEGIGGALAKWQQLNHVASTESVEALDMYGESIERASKSLSAMATDVMGRSAQMFNVVNDAVTTGAGKWATFWAVTKDVAAQLTMTGSGTENLTRLLDGLNVSTEANAATTKGVAVAHDQVTAAVDTRTQAEKFMAALEADAAVKLTAMQIANLDHLKEIGALNAKNAEGIGVSGAAFDKYKASIEAANKAAQELKKTTDEAAKVAAAAAEQTTRLWDEFTQIASKGGSAFDDQVASIDRWAADLQAKAQKAGTDTAEFYDALTSLWSAKLHQASLAAQQSMEQTADSAIASFDEMNASVMGIAVSFEGWNDAIMGVDKSLKAVIADQAKLSQGNTLDTATAAQDPEINALLHQGWSLKNAEAIKLARQWGFTPQLFDPLGNPESTPSKGERVPGYELGGPTGTGGISMLHGGEYVVPKGGALVRGGGGATTINVNVSGVWDSRSKAELTRVVSDGLTQALRTSRQLP